jgi:hypothetical protein
VSVSLRELSIGDPAERWEALGFAVSRESSCELGGVSVRLGGSREGIISWTVSGVSPRKEIDGLATHVTAEDSVAAQVTHPNGARAIDHLVIASPDYDRTVAALAGAGIELSRERDGGGFRQGFRRIGGAILELVEARSAPPGPARFWGLVVVVDDLDALGDTLGNRLRTVHAAVQSRRRIATLDRSAGLSTRVAFMTPRLP